MRKVYGECRILLAPSLWEEAYGRVATEAQLSGIPVVASDRGGLPEAVGPGGILVDPEGPIEEWVSAIRELWRNARYYSAISAAASAHAHRAELSYAYLLDAMEGCFLAACNRTVPATA